MSLLTSVLAALFPPRCIGCRRFDAWICSPCLERHLSVTHVSSSSAAAASSFTSLGPYANPFWRGGIEQLKFYGVQELGAVYGSLLADAFQQTPSYAALRRQQTPIIVTSIPLHARRFRERGYNQSALIASAVATALDVPSADLLRRTHYTPFQTQLTPDERLQNVQHAFVPACAPFAAPPTILLIDDVITTGATLSQAIDALQAFTPLSVHVLTVARAHEHPTVLRS